jgi:hypothetical protein
MHNLVVTVTNRTQAVDDWNKAHWVGDQGFTICARRDVGMLTPMFGGLLSLYLETEL